MFENVIGYTAIKKELVLTIDMMNNPEKYKQLGVHCTRGVIFNGEPGLGKTLTAKDFITASGWECVSYDRTSVSDNTDIDKTIYQELSFVCEQAVKLQPCIVFLDDFDKVDGSGLRGSAMGILQAFVDKYQNEDIFFLMTVNTTNFVPSSLCRPGRLEKVIKFDSPEYEDAKKIIQHYLSQKSFDVQLDYELAARLLQGQSCATLESVINTAGIYAAFNNKTCIEEDDVVRACLRVVYNAPESEEKQDIYARRQIACHEAGHAVMTTLLQPESLTLASIRKYEGNVNGFVSKSASGSKMSLNIDEIESEILIAYAGKAAIEIVFGDLDTGCLKDIDRVDVCVELLIEKFRCIGNAYMNASRAMLKDKYYFDAKKILVQNRTFLDAIMKNLDEKEILTYKDIFAIQQNVQNMKGEKRDV